MIKRLWDHTMLNVNDLQHAIDWFGQRGLTFQLGGHHPQWQTSNAVGYFGLNYIELLTTDQATNPGFERDDATSLYDAFESLPEHESFNTIGIRTNDIEAVHRSLADEFQVGRIMDGSRRTPTGELVTWRIFFVNQLIDGVAAPFFIEWPGSDSVRRYQLEQAGLLKDQPVGPVWVKSLQYDVQQPRVVAQAFGRFFDQPIQQRHEAYRIQLGNRQLDFVPGTANGITRLTFAGTGLMGHQAQYGDAVFRFE